MSDTETRDAYQHLLDRFDVVSQRKHALEDALREVLAVLEHMTGNPDSIKATLDKANAALNPENQVEGG